MPFTLLHTADWHIAKPFGRFPAEQASVLRRARLGAIDRLAAAARAGGASHVLVAGDTYDQPGLPDRALREPMARLAAHADLAWHIIPGNHDPATAGGVWERLVRDGVPANVHVHLQRQPVRLADDCWLLPAPLSTKATTRDPTDWMDAVATPPGVLRIGLAHGSAYGFGSERSASVAIAATRARSAGLSYLALGDWHGTLQVAPRTWYSGTPEPDGYLDNDPGHALLVRVFDPPAEPAVERVSIGEHRWLRREIDLARPTDLDGLERDIERLGPAAAGLLLHAEVSGRLTIGQDQELSRRFDQLDARVFHLVRGVDRVSLAPADTDIEALGDGALGELARELSRTAAESGHPEHAVAARALRRLFALADQAEEARP